MKKHTLVLIAMIAALLCRGARAQTQQILPSQIHCDYNSTPVVIILVPASLTIATANGVTTTKQVMQGICAPIDPSVFRLVPAGPSGPMTFALAVPFTAEPIFVFNEVPTGTVDGVNGTFVLKNAPNPSSSILVYVNGLAQASTSYTVAGNTITLLPGSVPPAGSSIGVSYWFPPPTP